MRMDGCYVISLAKDYFKFSCSHFTILSPDHAERLHGHNYQVQIELHVKKTHPQLGFAFDFNLIKPKVVAVCEKLDERILIPKDSPFLLTTDVKDNLEIRFKERCYSFPKEDVVLLPLVNITAEELSRYIWSEIRKVLHKDLEVIHLSVGVEETKGQSAAFACDL